MRVFALLALSFLLFLPAACGKKPTFVDAPPEAGLESTTTSVEGNEVPAPGAPAQPPSAAAISKKPRDPFPRLYPRPWL